MSEVKPACRDCRYWKKLNEEKGQCRATAPQIVGGMACLTNMMAVVWPQTAPDDWCGIAVNQLAFTNTSLSQSQYNAIASELGSAVANQVVEALDK